MQSLSRSMALRLSFLAIDSWILNVSCFKTGPKVYYNPSFCEKQCAINLALWLAGFPSALSFRLKTDLQPMGFFLDIFCNSQELFWQWISSPRPFQSSTCQHPINQRSLYSRWLYFLLFCFFSIKLYSPLKLRDFHLILLIHCSLDFRYFIGKVVVSYFYLRAWPSL